MLGQQAQKCLDQAARETFARIRQDRERVIPRIKSLLDHIETNLFDPGLDVNQLKRRCGVRDNSIPILFHAQVGMPPHAYIEEHRLSTGCRLLAETDLKIWQIADLLGYSSIQVFSRAFTRWSGQRPTSYRKKSRHTEDREPIEAPGHATEAPTDEIVADEATANADDRGIEPAVLNRALAGELEAREARSLIERLLHLYPDHRGREQPPVPAIRDQPAWHPRTAIPKASRTAGMGRLLAREEIERIRAEAVWSQIAGRDSAEQRRAIRDLLDFETPALIEHLFERCVVESRTDRARGIHVAELALVAIDAFEHRTDTDSARGLRARGWSCLANAQRLALDFSGAERALATAEEHLPDEKLEPLAHAEILRSKAGLRRDQRRYDEAAELAGRSLALFRQHGDDREIGRTLLLQGNVLLEVRGYQEGVRTIQQALEHLETAADPYLKLAAYQNLADIFARSGAYADARALLPEIATLRQEYPSPALGYYSLWLEGLLAAAAGRYDSAESLLRTARDGFCDARWISVAALVALDLALLYADQDRPADASDTALEILPLMDTLNLRGEALIALGILRRAAESGAITTAVLRRMRSAAGKTRAERPRVLLSQAKTEL